MDSSSQHIVLLGDRPSLLPLLAAAFPIKTPATHYRLAHLHTHTPSSNDAPRIALSPMILLGIRLSISHASPTDYRTSLATTSMRYLSHYISLVTAISLSNTAPESTKQDIFNGDSTATCQATVCHHKRHRKCRGAISGAFIMHKS